MSRKLVKKCSNCIYYKYDKNFYKSFGNEYYQNEHMCIHPDFGNFEILVKHKCHFLPIRTITTFSFCDNFKSNYFE